MNAFRSPKWNEAAQIWARPLDLKYLRVCSVYRLLKRGAIGKARALELLAQRHSEKEMTTLRATVALWQAHSLKGMKS